MPARGRMVAGHAARKRFGQNFLQDGGIIRRIADAVGPKPGETVVEIGPGMGALTAALLSRHPALHVIELDRDLVPGLRVKFFDYPEFTVHEGDALKFDFRALAGDSKLRLLGNLPYNISTPLIFHLLDNADVIHDMHFMLQKEVVARLAAACGDSAYGRLSVMVQYHCRVIPLFDVPPECFRPQPKVMSGVVRLIPHATLPHPVANYKLLERVVRTAFNARRKTLRKALESLVSVDDLRALAIDDNLRPENLTLADYVAITTLLEGRDLAEEFA